MEVVQILSSVILALVILYLGTVEKRIMRLFEKQERLIEREEVKEMLALELKVVAIEYAGVKEDLDRIESKLDKLLDKYHS